MILLFAYLVGYAIAYPKMFMAILKYVSHKPYDTEDVVFSLAISALITFFYPAIFVVIIFNNFVIQPFISYLNRSE
jgi:hypothetical protein